VPLKAAQYYRRAWKNKPAAKDLDLLASVYLQGHYLDQALDQARRAAEMKPTARRWALVGRILLRQKNYAAAYRALCRAAGISDKGGRHSLLAGYAAMQMERLDQARRAFGLCLKHAAPKSGTAREAVRALEAVKAYEEQIRQRTLPGQVAMKKP
jgi:Flp pilus assembly protein TadD